MALCAQMKENEMETELLTIPQFCQAVNCGKTRAYQLINEKQIRALKNGKKSTR